MLVYWIFQFTALLIHGIVWGLLRVFGDYNFEGKLRKKLAFVDIYSIHTVAGNIGGNYIWWIARKSSKIEIGGF